MVTMASGFEDVQADTGDARVRLVVDVEVAAIVAAVGVAQVRVVRIAVGVLVGVAHDPLGFVGHPQPVALQWLNTGMRMISRMDGTPKTRTSPEWPAPEAVIVIQLTRRHIGALGTLGRLPHHWSRPSSGLCRCRQLPPVRPPLQLRPGMSVFRGWRLPQCCYCHSARFAPCHDVVSLASL